MSWPEIKKAVNSDLSKPLNVKIDELAEPGMFGMDVISGLRFLRGVYPYHNGAADITISADTTWDDDEGYKRVGKLTIASGVKLTIRQNPFFILADEIEFGDANSWISNDGYNGVDAAGGGFPTDIYAKGGYHSSNEGVIGGCGGGMLFVLCNHISGAAGKISANGGNARAINSSSYSLVGGQGALSETVLVGSAAAEAWATAGMLPLTAYIGKGGHSTHAGTGGGSGGGGTGYASGGGSGIGGGGGAAPSGTMDGFASSKLITPSIALLLVQLRCKGGGGGALARNSSTTSNNGGGGGGGGYVQVMYKTKAVTPIIEANGGLGATQGTFVGGNGGAGQTWLLEV